VLAASSRFVFVPTFVLTLCTALGFARQADALIINIEFSGEITYNKVAQ